jgi:hypothetical protein
MEPTERWTPQSASDLYDVASWGKGYFSVGENGHVLVHPEKEAARSIDLKQLVDTLVLRGINLPILIRFADILKHRLADIHGAFETAINEHKYQGGYCCVYPIKVNQQRQVVEWRPEPVIAENPRREQPDVEAQRAEQQGERPVELVAEAAPPPGDDLADQVVRLQRDGLAQVNAQVLERDRQQMSQVQRTQGSVVSLAGASGADPVQVRGQFLLVHPD